MRGNRRRINEVYMFFRQECLRVATDVLKSMGANDFCNVGNFIV